MSDHPNSGTNRPSHSSPLEELFLRLRLQSRLYALVERRAPWGAKLSDAVGCQFHLIIEGECHLQAEGVEPLVLSAGDFIVLPRPLAHQLFQTTAEHPLYTMPNLAPSEVEFRHVVTDGPGPLTKLICGVFTWEHELINHLLATLPPLLLVRSMDTVLSVGVSTLISAELQANQPGATSVLERLTEVLFVEAVRLASRQERVSVGWLRAIADPALGQALAAMHLTPAQPWTVATLAAKAGLSRTSFAARFTQLVGEPPLTYLTRWRMLKAAHDLRSTMTDLDQIAEQNGYASERAFIRVFRRYLGVSPQAYRRAKVKS